MEIDLKRRRNFWNDFGSLDCKVLEGTMDFYRLSFRLIWKKNNKEQTRNFLNESWIANLMDGGFCVGSGLWDEKYIWKSAKCVKKSEFRTWKCWFLDSNQGPLGVQSNALSLRPGGSLLQIKKQMYVNNQKSPLMIATRNSNLKI